MRNKFDQEISELNAEVMKMSSFIEMTIAKAMQALKYNDHGLAKEVYENDHVADELEVSIEQKSLRILLSQQPVARDLRTISAALKMITDMERICDQAADIGEIVLHFEDGVFSKNPQLLYHMAEQCVTMVTKAIDSFVNSDYELANAVILSDDEIDRLFVEVRAGLIQEIVDDPQSGHLMVDFLMIAKYLERIGDHAQNIAEWVIFSITGEHKNQRIL